MSFLLHFMSAAARHIALRRWSDYRADHFLNAVAACGRAMATILAAGLHQRSARRHFGVIARQYQPAAADTLISGRAHRIDIDDGILTAFAAHEFGESVRRATLLRAAGVRCRADKTSNAARRLVFAGAEPTRPKWRQIDGTSDFAANPCRHYSITG